MVDHTDHTLAIGGCADCDRVATEIGYAVMGIPDTGRPEGRGPVVPAGGNHRVPRSYLFDLGDSGSGPIGYVARITARTRREAEVRLSQLLPEYVELDQRLNEPMSGDEYLTVYFGHDYVAASKADVVPAECLACEAEIPEDADRCPHEHEHPEEASTET